MQHALVVLPLTLAVLLVSLCVPVACFASAEPARPADPAGCGHQTAPLAAMPMHGAIPGSAPAPVHQHGDPIACKHSAGNVQAPNIDQQVRAADLVAVAAVASPVVPAAAPLVTVVKERPSRPPGLVLTVSQLRI